MRVLLQNYSGDYNTGCLLKRPQLTNEPLDAFADLVNVSVI